MIGHSFPTLEEKPYNLTMNKNRIIPKVGISVLLAGGAGLWLWLQSATPRAVVRADVPAPPATAPPPAAAPAPAPTAPLPPPPSAGSAAASAPASPPPPPTEAELTLDDAIKKVAALPAVAAELTEKVEMLKQKFEIHGTYRKAPGGRLFLHLIVSGLPGSTGEMRQVCDGTTLWDYQQILESRFYRKITLGPVLEKLKAPELDAQAREQVLARLGLAGPDVLLSGLRKTIHFDQKDEATEGGHPVWILRGTWQDRQGILGPNQQPLREDAPLPAYIPSQVTLTIGKEDGWPYKVRLAGRQPTILFDTRRTGPDGRPIGNLNLIQKIEPSKLELTYTIVSLDPAFKPDDFVFPVPAGAHVEDATEAEVSALDQIIQAKIAAKKAETARSEPLLEQSIELPKAATAPEGPATATPPPLFKPK
jgi:hypothetical protein